MDQEQVFFNPDGRWTNIHTFLKNGKCLYSGKSLYTMKKEMPRGFVLAYAAAANEQNKIDEIKYCEKPHEISEEEYFDSLEVLPPSDWQRVGDLGEYFHVSEAYTADIYRCCFEIKIGQKSRYFSCLNRGGRKRDLFMELYKRL